MLGPETITLFTRMTGLLAKAVDPERAAKMKAQLDDRAAARELKEELKDEKLGYGKIYER